MPPTITYEEAKGFGLFMLTMAHNGRADEVVDLAKVDFFRQRQEVLRYLHDSTTNRGLR